MKRWVAFTGILIFGIAAVVVSERRKVDVQASPAALLYLVADTEQELTRMPVSFTRMSDIDEIRAGDELAQSYATDNDSHKAPETAEVEQYMTRVGSQLASRAHRKLPYKFHYIPSPYLINAFALPGGHVYVGAGLLSLMDSEDELAAVIGHEIEHVDHYHCAERLQLEQALRKIPLGGLMGLPIEVFEAGYSKDQEMEADREGTRLAVASGYSPNGAIRMFEAFDELHKEYQAKAKSPQQEVTDVALETVEGYFRSHPLPSERISQIQKMIAEEQWPTRPERDLAVAYIFLTERAQNALEEQKYSQAEHLANMSLHLRPEQAKALEVLARAQFAQANFSAAAGSYRKILDLGTSKGELVNGYALSLAASNRATANEEFAQWKESAKGDKPREVDVATAGLNLLSGRPEFAEKLEQQLANSDDAQEPVWIGELGWWHYLAGDYQRASELLWEAVQQRPGNTQISLRMAWVRIDQKRYADALQLLETISYDADQQPERAMARAVTQWQAQEKEDAFRYFEIAIRGQSTWAKPQWVEALYSRTVVQSIEQMQTEAEARPKRATVAGR